MEQLTRYTYPFTAIVGQEEMKLALILNVINPKLAGVLIRGEKGTAKSTAVRSMAALLPENRTVADCTYGCNPDDLSTMCPSCRDRSRREKKLPTARRRMRVIELPVSATEDRVVGTLDLEEAIKKGEKRFEPGVLAEANRNMLYVDEVNLLDDHIVDVLLDSAAMGVNTVEREGVSFTHPSNFILVGTMNPEEGELRPQLLDRFGLCAQIRGILDPAQRVEVIRRRISFEEDPAAFCSSWEQKQDQLRQRILNARQLLPRIRVAEEMLYLIATIAVEMGVDGHRADLTMLKAAKTMAAFNGREEVNETDISSTADLALRHRMRRQPLQNAELDHQKLLEILERSTSPAMAGTEAQNQTRVHL